MKYLSTILLTFVLLSLPALTFAQSAEFRVVDKDGTVQKGDMIPVAEYAQMEMAQFSSFVSQPDLTNEELSEAISDLTRVLEIYLESLQD